MLRQNLKFLTLFYFVFFSAFSYSQSIKYIKDFDRTLDYNQVSNMRVNLLNYNENQPLLGINGRVWLSIDLSEYDPNATYVIDIDYPHLDHVYIYYNNSTYELGDLSANAEKGPISFVCNLKELGNSKKVILCVDTLMQLRLPIKIMKYPDFEKLHQARNKFEHLYIGSCITLVLLSFTFALQSFFSGERWRFAFLIAAITYNSLDFAGYNALVHKISPYFFSFGPGLFLFIIALLFYSIIHYDIYKIKFKIIVFMSSLNALFFITYFIFAIYSSINNHFFSLVFPTCINIVKALMLFNISTALFYLFPIVHSFMTDKVRLRIFFWPTLTYFLVAIFIIFSDNILEGYLLNKIFYKISMLFMITPFTLAFIAVIYASNDIKMNKTLKKFCSVPEKFLHTHGPINLTIIFIDIVNYSAITRKYQQSEIHRFIKKFFNIVEFTINTKYGYINNFLEDSIIITYWNNDNLTSKMDNPIRWYENLLNSLTNKLKVDHVKNTTSIDYRTPMKTAIHDAIKIKKMITNHDMKDEFGYEACEICIGIASGDCSLEKMGNKRNILMPIGNIVHLARKLEGLAKTTACPKVDTTSSKYLGLLIHKSMLESYCGTTDILQIQEQLLQQLDVYVHLTKFNPSIEETIEAYCVHEITVEKTSLKRS